MKTRIIFIVAIVVALACTAADWYLGQKATITSFHPQTNYLVMVMGTGTNAVYRLISPSNLLHQVVLVPSPNTTSIVDCTYGPRGYYWTNMVTNVVIVLSNITTPRTLDFFFTGATNNGPNFTVAFTNLTASSVIKWGLLNATNGATAFNVTNNIGAGASLTFWTPAVVEAYYSPTH